MFCAIVYRFIEQLMSMCVLWKCNVHHPAPPPFSHKQVVHPQFRIVPYTHIHTYTHFINFFFYSLYSSFIYKNKSSTFDHLFSIVISHPHPCITIDWFSHIEHTTDNNLICFIFLHLKFSSWLAGGDDRRAHDEYNGSGNQNSIVSSVLLTSIVLTAMSRFLQC